MMHNVRIPHLPGLRAIVDVTVDGVEVEFLMTSEASDKRVARNLEAAIDAEQLRMRELDAQHAAELDKKMQLEAQADAQRSERQHLDALADEGATYEQVTDIPTKSIGEQRDEAKAEALKLSQAARRELGPNLRRKTDTRSEAARAEDVVPADPMRMKSNAKRVHLVLRESIHVRGLLIRDAGQPLCRTLTKEQLKTASFAPATGVTCSGCLIKAQRMYKLAGKKGTVKTLLKQAELSKASA